VTKVSENDSSVGTLFHQSVIRADNLHLMTAVTIKNITYLLATLIITKHMH